MGDEKKPVPIGCRNALRQRYTEIMPKVVLLQSVFLNQGAEPSRVQDALQMLEFARDVAERYPYYWKDVENGLVKLEEDELRASTTEIRLAQQVISSVRSWMRKLYNNIYIAGLDDSRTCFWRRPCTAKPWRRCRYWRATPTTRVVCGRTCGTTISTACIANGKLH